MSKQRRMLTTYSAMAVIAEQGFTGVSKEKTSAFLKSTIPKSVRRKRTKHKKMVKAQNRRRRK